MKVLKIIHTLGHGGAENTFRWLAWSLCQEGIDVSVAIPGITGPREENWMASALDELDIPYLTFNRSGSSGRLFREIEAVVDRVRPDLVHSHLLDSNFYSGVVSWRKGIPHISTEHGEVALGQTAKSRIKYASISCCSSYIICVSDAVKERARRVMAFQRKLQTVNNGIPFFEKVRSTFRQEFSIPRTALLIGNVGNLYPVKGQIYLVRAFAELLRLKPDSYLALVGRGAEEGILRKQVRQLMVPQDRVIFTGFRNDVPNVMSAFDVYVQPSLSEGHPVAVLEAMSLGIPVIATDVGGIPELVGNNQYGTLAAARSWESLYKCIHQFALDPQSFVERSLAARQKVRDCFSVQKMARNYVELYRRAISI